MQPVAFILVYFVYGLAFFSLGLVLFLESGRYTTLGESRSLKFLAGFGLLHGLHEWIDMLLIMAGYFSIYLHEQILWGRAILLVFSFLSLVIFGIQVVFPEKDENQNGVYWAMLLFTVYLIVIKLSNLLSLSLTGYWFQSIDLFARYMLAVPGAVLAVFAFRLQSQEQADENYKIRQTLSRLGLWFGLYAVSQFLGPSLQIYALSASEQIKTIIRFWIPGTRSLIAVMIASDMIRAIQFSEILRQKFVRKTRREKMDALEETSAAIAEQNEMRRTLMFQMVRMQEEERARISRELHDEAAQLITALSANLAALRNDLPKDQKQNKLLHRMTNLIDEVSLNIYRLVHELRPAQLDELGLVSAMDFLLDRSKNDLGLIIDANIESNCPRFDPMIEAVIYRAAQEALNNVYRHAETIKVSLSLRHEQDQLCLEVRDDGIGFKIDTIDRAKSFGIAGMLERVEMVGGMADVISDLGKSVV